MDDYFTCCCWDDCSTQTKEALYAAAEIAYKHLYGKPEPLAPDEVFYDAIGFLTSIDSA